MMRRHLSQARAAGRAEAICARRRVHTPAPNPPIADGAGTPPIAKKPVTFGASDVHKSTTAATDSRTGSSLPKVLLLGLLSTPAAAAVYLKQHRDWNPSALKENERWLKFRELVLGRDEVEKQRVVVDFGDAIGNDEHDVKEEEKKMKKEEKKKKKEEKKMKKEEKEKKKKEEKEEAKEKKESEKKVQDKAEKAEKKLAKAEKKAQKAEKKVAKLKDQVQAEKTEAPTDMSAHEEGKNDSQTSGPASVAALTVVQQKVNAETAKAREEIATLAAEACPEHLTRQMDKHMQTTTSDLLSSLKAESEAAAAEVDEHYLTGLQDLDAHALAIRVAQLAVEMKHRSKWEAVRLVEALRHVQEEAQKKSVEVVRRQAEVHEEVLARELRLQQELLSRQMRDEMDALTKQYADDLARNVSEQRTALLSKLQQTFAQERKAMEAHYAQRLKSVQETMQQSLTDERKKRVEELEKYRAELRALGTVLDSSSTYEAFSHRVHQASMAALALSDRVEAAAPLRSEIRALRAAARNDPLIEAAVQSLPQDVVEHGAPSVRQLQERFKVVKSAGHRVALVPETSGLIGQAFGTFLSVLMLPPGGPIDGPETDAVLSRAEFALKAGDLDTAIVEMEGLSGLPAQLAQDWIAAAKSRLAVEQTSKVIKAHVALLAASCS
ncbi:hypothetical protein PsorP6_003161 [Peronosclerospora sorghi]|uniref:Uncharacterized protein n=1 Tax=Peronosclerospora sorghi TaxID=230839 RepID=A0ACC0VLP2_9STRA|nr:hypothetical protein PsorP6_003161 [Peronosclerospora sorghi]